MSYKKIVVDLAPPVIEEVRQCLEDVRRKLPFLIILSKGERRHLFRMSDKSLAFVENSLTAARNHPDELPASFDLVQFTRDVGLAEALIEVEVEIDKLRAEINDTKVAVSSDAIVQGTNVYGHLKAAAKHSPGLKSVVQQLSARFAKSGHTRPAGAEKKNAS